VSVKLAVCCSDPDVAVTVTVDVIGVEPTPELLPPPPPPHPTISPKAPNAVTMTSK